MKLAYLGRSTVQAGPYRSTVELRPNLSREVVWFDGELERPTRFREAMSALHEVVAADLRFKRSDRAAYRAWLANKAQEERELRARLADDERLRELERVAGEGPMTASERAAYRKAHRRYWTARRLYARDLARNDPEVFRHLVPCDPIVTVAPDALLFEGFSKDESSYGCLILEREAAGDCLGASLGTTNVDYSFELYDHFQTLRTYRPTRLHVDQRGFEVNVEGEADYREEKIDLPPSWLRGFGQISAATGLASRKAELSLDTIYSILAFLGRHREKQGPRSLRFTLTPGRPPMVTIEPWGKAIVSHGPVYQGERSEEIKVWGRRRLSVLARLLPLIDKLEVHLLGTGFPSLWIASMGELTFVLGLSGWTTNDWTSGTNLDLLTSTFQADEWTIEQAARHLERERSLSLAELTQRIDSPESAIRGALHRLSQRGQCLFDFSTATYRYRQILSAPLGESLIGSEPLELTEGRKLFVSDRVKLLDEERLDESRRVVSADVAGTRCEALFDADGFMSRARCPCYHHQRYGIRKGPCRHLIALRFTARYADISFGPGGL